VVDVMRQDGYTPIEVWASCEHNELIGGCLTTASLTTALAMLFARDRPSLVVTIADRKETLATAIAASYQHIPLFHLLSAEHSGSIDERVRAAVAALADYHHDPLKDGCPSVDVARRAWADPSVTLEELGGTGSALSLQQPFLILMQHPVSTEPDAGTQLEQTMVALTSIPCPVLVFWPGEESGSEASSKVLRQLRESYCGNHAWHFVRSCAPRRFYRLLSQCCCLVGNSSVGVREAGALGVPVVNIGTRQTGRVRAENVQDCDYTVEAIRQAVEAQMRHGPYPTSTLYGDGQAGLRVAKWIQEIVG
jgi:UDP-N-acetylglucosamine 2-epimerase